MKSEACPEPEQIPAISADDSRESHPERFCPTCGAELLERKCKLFCPDPACGYYMSCSYMSCSDYY